MDGQTWGDQMVKKKQPRGVPEPDYTALAHPELEAIIQAVVDRKEEASKRGENDPEYRFCLRQLAGLRRRHELAGPIMEEIDPGWGYC
jgi:hypothetical protein